MDNCKNLEDLVNKHKNKKTACHMYRAKKANCYSWENFQNYVEDVKNERNRPRQIICCIIQW